MLQLPLPAPWEGIEEEKPLSEPDAKEKEVIAFFTSSEPHLGHLVSLSEE